MSREAHTADRWTARFSGYSEGWTIYGHNEDGEYLVAENIGPYADDEEMEAEAEREARLIAAAPALLEAGMALQEARRAHKLNPGRENAGRVHAASLAFDAAIQSATGEG